MFYACQDHSQQPRCKAKRAKARGRQACNATGSGVLDLRFGSVLIMHHQRYAPPAASAKWMLAHPLVSLPAGITSEPTGKNGFLQEIQRTIWKKTRNTKHCNC